MTNDNNKNTAAQKLAKLYLDNLNNFEEFTTDEHKAKHLTLLSIKKQAKDFNGNHIYWL